MKMHRTKSEMSWCNVSIHSISAQPHAPFMPFPRLIRRRSKSPWIIDERRWTGPMAAGDNDYIAANHASSRADASWPLSSAAVSCSITFSDYSHATCTRPTNLASRTGSERVVSYTENTLQRKMLDSVVSPGFSSVLPVLPYMMVK